MSPYPQGRQERDPAAVVDAVNAFALRAWRALGPDRAILFSVLGTVRSMIGGSLLAFLIALYFTPVEQGFYYTFGSVLALQVFVELGLGNVLLQFASHEWAGLREGPRGVEGDADSLSRLSDLLRLSLRWYGIAALLSTAGLSMGGYWFFSHQPQREIVWAAPWVCLCILTGIKLALTPFFAILEGCGRLTTVYGYRLTEGFLALGVAALAVFGGAGLWTAVAVSLSTIVAGIAFLSVGFATFFVSLLRVRPTTRLRWRAEILPLQWRIAISYLSGYFVFQLFTPVLFNYHGPVVAGQFGLAWSLVSAVSAVATAWINTKVPSFGLLIARRDFRALDNLALRAAAGSLLVATAGSLAALVGLRALQLFAPHLASRFLPIFPTSLFLIATILAQLLYVQSTYLRAHKQEPFLWLSVIGGALIGTSTWYFGSRFGPGVMAAGYLGVVSLFSLPVGTWIFLSCRASWHAAEPVEVCGPNTPRTAS